VLLVAFVATLSDPLLAVDSDKAAYFGGTHAPYAGAKDPIEGQLNTRLEDALAVATTVLLGPIGLVSLFSKKRKHYLTIGYKDETNKDQVAVIELGKDLVRTTLAIVETRSGKQIEYQDDEARKASRN
jgi:hypothetical protein